VLNASIGAGFERLQLVTVSFQRSFQQPLFRSLQIGKCLDIYTSITSRQQEKPSRIQSLRYLNKCDFYPEPRENPRFFRRKVFFCKGECSLGFRNINWIFIVRASVRSSWRRREAAPRRIHFDTANPAGCFSMRHPARVGSRLSRI
jgi:hypothetical protein